MVAQKTSADRETHMSGLSFTAVFQLQSRYPQLR